MQNRVRVYVDGLNFYYGVARPYNFKWVDMESLFLALVQQIVPDAKIEKIFLFTAIVRGDAQNRQQIYLNALREKCGDRLELVKGFMMETHKRGKVAGAKSSDKVTIETYEEKATDVNLACQMVSDAYTAAGRDFDISCLVSNDSDFDYPLKIKKQLKQRTLLIFPRIKNSKKPISNSLKKYVHHKDRIDSIDKAILTRHRLPDPIGKWFSPKSPGWK